MTKTAAVPVIAIDGPSAAGKGTIARLVADKLGFHWLDSGALYQRRWKRRGTITYRFGETIAAGLAREEIEARVSVAINQLNPVAGA